MRKEKSYLIKNARPVGFAGKGKEELELINIGINKGKVSYIGQNDPETAYDRKIDLKGSYLSPGWIDLHTHIYGVCDIAVDPVRVGPATGVILPVDAGTAGEASFDGFKKYIVNNYDFPIKAYLNIGSTGIVAANRVSEVATIDCVNLDNTIRCIENNRDIIKGIKVRASRAIVREWGDKVVKLAKTVSNIVDLPLVVHIGEPPIFLKDLVEILDKGDMITHCYNGKRGSNLLQDKNIIHNLKTAQEKGILLDVGHGSASYSQKAAEKAYKLEIHPYSTGTDIHNQNIEGPVWDLPLTMSKIMALGYTLPEIIEKVTKNAAEFLGLKDWYTLKENNQAYFTAFKIKEGEFPVEDSAATGEVTAAAENERYKFKIKKIICPEWSFYEENVIKAESNYIKGRRNE